MASFNVLGACMSTYVRMVFLSPNMNLCNSSALVELSTCEAILSKVLI